MKTVQFFTDDYLEKCKKMSSEDIAIFIEDFRKLQFSKSSSKLISLKVQEDLLVAFRKKCSRKGLKYQSQIKNLMLHWLSEI